MMYIQKMKLMQMNFGIIKEELNMKAINIEWDVDYEEELEDLPTEIEIPNGMTDEEEISDYITDKTGFCHYSFELVD